MCCSLLWVWAADKANRNKRQTAVRSVFLRSDIQHRLSGAHEARRRFARTGGVFFAEIQREGFAAPRGGGKRVDTCGFYPLNSRFPLFLSLAHTRDRRPLRNRGTAEDFYYRVFLNLFEGSDTVLLHIRLNLRRVRHNSAARFVSAL